MTDGKQAVESIRENYAGAVLSDGEHQGQHWIEVHRDRLVEICEWLRDDPQMDYDCLLDVTAVHWPHDEEPMQLVYHLYSFKRNDRVRLKTRAADEGPVPSLAGLWKSAEWNERETYDMFGIRFEGHPDLRRILMPDDYTDFPLRKEIPLYRG